MKSSALIGSPLENLASCRSWNRSASKQGDYASLFQPIAGYQAVADGRATKLSGLAKLDDYSFTTTLTRPAGYWTTTVALWPFWVVDSKVITSAGDGVWFTQPQTLIGGGPFRMTARSAGQALDFEAVPHWFGGSTGRITHVHIDVI